MKKALSLILAAFSAGMILCSCSGKESNATADELLKATVECGVDFGELVSVKDSDIKYTYDLDGSLYDDFSASVSGNLAYAEEVVFVKASSEENIPKIEEALNARLESRKETLQSYAPAEYDKLSKSEVKTRGSYVYLIVCADSKTALKAAEKAF